MLITGDSHTGQLQKGKLLLQGINAWLQGVDLSIRSLGNGKIYPTPFFIDRGEFAEICDLSYRKQFKQLPLVETDGEPMNYGITVVLHTARIWRHPDWVKFTP